MFINHGKLDPVHCRLLLPLNLANLFRPSASLASKAFFSKAFKLYLESVL